MKIKYKLNNLVYIYDVNTCIKCSSCLGVFLYSVIGYFNFNMFFSIKFYINILN